jgi:hypothetical protein
VSKRTQGWLWAAALAALLALAAVAGCGEDDQRTFNASGFIAAANDRGAGLVLDAPLESSRGELELYELRFEGAGAGTAPQEAVHTHGGGTLVVAPSDEEALAEYERCESSASLICYRAANVALYLEGALAPGDIKRLEAAVGSMAAD